MRLALIGTGLIGGSAAWAMKEAGIFTAVTACNHTIRNAQRAVEIGFADRATTSVAEAVADADAIMVAVPVLAMKEVFEQIAQHMQPNALITDVGSTRTSVIAAARETLGEKFVNYAPFHPIAGGEMPGIDYAYPELYEGAKIICTPDEGMGGKAIAFWRDAWKKVGGELFDMTPAEHDSVFAQVSHLPHILAYTLVDAMAQASNASTTFSFVGAGFKDFTRIAASSPAMWRDICVANSEAILQSIEMFERELKTVKKMIRKSDGKGLIEVFDRASHARRSVGTRKTVKR